MSLKHVQLPPSGGCGLSLRMVGSAGADRATASVVTSPSAVSYSQGSLPSTASSLWTRRTSGSEAGKVGKSLIARSGPMPWGSSASLVAGFSGGGFYATAAAAPSTATLSAARIRVHGSNRDLTLFSKVLDLEGARVVN